MASTYRLVMRSGPTAGKTFLLDKAETTIGRDLSNDIVINDSEASRNHARIFLQGGNYIIEDLGSTNGTSVNGQRLMGPYVLRPGELIMFGESISLLFEMVQTADENATVISPRKGAPQPPPQRHVPPAPQQAPAYSGQVPAQPPAAQPAQTKKRRPIMIVIIVVALLLLCACVAGLIMIDQSNAWCSWLGWAFNMFSPGLCP
ncbi:MAG: FHA domain-containing protein [Anaerolineaceae bacterium]|nr:FHA domain-containing protein [Anaerolineaceae bacterium]